ncbi:MAG: FliH/SctL family protein [Thermodesulfobacteriota bacterium]
MSRTKPEPAAAGERKVTGRVFMGVGGNGPGEMRIEDMDSRRRPNVWTAKTEEEYFRRVRDRAAAMAREVVDAAQAEIEALRVQAREEGLAEGRRLAEQEKEQFLSAQSRALAQSLGGVCAGCEDIWNEHRQELVTLVRLTVEKLLNIELSERRAEILDHLLVQAVEAIDSARALTVVVSPADKDLVEELLARARAENPRLAQFNVRLDPAMAPGGLRLESEQGMVDNTLEGRWKAIEPILDQLAIVEEGA